MEPRIQYAQTKDGVSIAYATRGQGPPLVIWPLVFEQFFSVSTDRSMASRRAALRLQYTRKLNAASYHRRSRR